MFEDYIEVGDEIEMNLLQNIFKQIIFNLLHIDVTNNRCKIV